MKPLLMEKMGYSGRTTQSTANANMRDKRQETRDKRQH
jgi:hypothetical protein